MAKKTPAELTEQNAAKEQMSSELLVVHDEIVDIADNLVTSELLGRYDIGAKVLEATRVKNKKTYGTNAMELLAAALGCRFTPDELRSMRRVASTYSRKKIEELSKSRAPDGSMIRYSHLDILANVEAQLRNNLLSRISKEGMTVRELQTAVVQAVGGARTSHRGRPLVPPKTVSAGLAQISRYSGEFSRRGTMWFESVLQKLKEAAPEECSEDLADRVNECLDQAQNGYMALHTTLEELNKIKERIDRIVANSAADCEDSTDDFDTDCEADEEPYGDEEDDYSDDYEDVGPPPVAEKQSPSNRVKSAKKAAVEKKSAATS